MLLEASIAIATPEEPDVEGLSPERLPDNAVAPEEDAKFEVEVAISKLSVVKVQKPLRNDLQER